MSYHHWNLGNIFTFGLMKNKRETIDDGSNNTMYPNRHSTSYLLNYQLQKYVNFISNKNKKYLKRTFGIDVVGSDVFVDDKPVTSLKNIKTKSLYYDEEEEKRLFEEDYFEPYTSDDLYESIEEKPKKKKPPVKKKTNPPKKNNNPKPPQKTQKPKKHDYSDQIFHERVSVEELHEKEKQKEPKKEIPIIEPPTPQSNMNYLTISEMQDVNEVHIDKVLKECSKKYRNFLYKNHEWAQEIAQNGYYVFLEDEDEDFLRKVNNYLRNNDIVTDIYNKEEFDLLIQESQDTLKHQDFNQLDQPFYLQQNQAMGHYEQPLQELPAQSVDLNISINHIDHFDAFFANKIIGQEDVLEKIKEQLILISYDCNKERQRPLGVFFFVGPTGVGKTQTCKELSRFIYNNLDINRFDMSEYKSEVAIQKLIGAPNGYVGYEEGGTLINAMKRNPNSIILFDEIEKADKTVFDLFLQILDEGFVTSNKGERISFKNNFIVFTSNLGSAQISHAMNHDEIKELVKNYVSNYFYNELNRPEILARIGIENVIVFNTITSTEDQFRILDIFFHNLTEDFKKNKTILEFDRTDVYTSVLKDVDITKGARDIRNVFDKFRKQFTKALYDNRLSLEYLVDKTVQFNYTNGKVSITNVA